MQTASQHIEPLGLFSEKPKPRLYDRVIEVLRVHRYSHRTEQAYVGWIRRFLEFHHGRHPALMAEPEVTAFLSHLAVVIGIVLIGYRHYGNIATGVAAAPPGAGDGPLSLSVSSKRAAMTGDV